MNGVLIKLVKKITTPQKSTKFVYEKLNLQVNIFIGVARLEARVGASSFRTARRATHGGDFWVVAAEIFDLINCKAVANVHFVCAAFFD